MPMLISYTIRREELIEHLALVDAVYADLARTSPAGIGYSTYQLPGEGGFVELLTGDAGPGPLAASPAFARFRSTLDARCGTAPSLTELRAVGAYPAVSLGAAQART